MRALSVGCSQMLPPTQTLGRIDRKMLGNGWTTGPTENTEGEAGQVIHWLASLACPQQ